MAGKSLHSICRWTFNPGKGGFVPADMRPEWGGKFGTPEMIKLVADKVRPRLPDNIELGIEMHYDAEVDEKNAAAVADALVGNKLYLALITPGAHSHFAYGGIASLDANERKAAKELDTKSLLNLLAGRETAKAEDMMRAAVVAAQRYFDEMNG